MKSSFCCVIGIKDLFFLVEYALRHLNLSAYLLLKNLNYRYIEILQFSVYDSKYHTGYRYNNLTAK